MSELHENDGSSTTHDLGKVVEKGQEEDKEEEEEEDSPEDAMDFEVGSLSRSERRTLIIAQKLTKAAEKVLKSISKPLLQGT